MNNCTKKEFSSRKAALGYIRKRGTRLAKISGRVRAYFCKHCNCWHLTTKKKRKSEKVGYNKREQTKNLKELCKCDK